MPREEAEVGTHLGETGDNVPIQSSLSLEGPLFFEHTMHTVVELWNSLPGSRGWGPIPHGPGTPGPGRAASWYIVLSSSSVWPWVPSLLRLLWYESSPGSLGVSGIPFNLVCFES